MGRGFLGTDKDSPQLDPFCPQHQGSRNPPGIGNPPGGNDRDVHRIRHLGHQGHSGQFPNVAARLGPFGDDGVGACPLHPAGQGHRGHHRDDLDPRGLPTFDVFARVSGTGGDHRYLLVDDHLGYCRGVVAHQHNVDSKGLVGEGLGLPDHFPHHLHRGVGGGDDAQAAPFGYGRGQFGVGNPGHAALENGVLNPQKLSQFGFQHGVFPSFLVTPSAAAPRRWSAPRRIPRHRQASPAVLHPFEGPRPWREGCWRWRCSPAAPNSNRPAPWADPAAS